MNLVDGSWLWDAKRTTIFIEMDVKNTVYFDPSAINDINGNLIPMIDSVGLVFHGGFVAQYSTEKTLYFHRKQHLRGSYRIERVFMSFTSYIILCFTVQDSVVIKLSTDRKHFCWIRKQF